MKIAFVFPHPDDETIFTGGTILRHVANGDSVAWVCTSYGERGGATERRSPKSFYRMFLLAGKFHFLLSVQTLTVWWLSFFRKENENLKKTRKDEAEKVANILGVSSVKFWEVPDMRFSWRERELTQKLKKYFEETQPDIVYTLHPNGITGHPDHVALSNCVSEAVNASETKKPVLRYVTFSKELAEKYKLPLLGTSDNVISKKIELSVEELKRKIEAITAYRSQQYLWKIFLEKYPELLENEYFLEA